MRLGEGGPATRSSPAPMYVGSVEARSISRPSGQALSVRLEGREGREDSGTLREAHWVDCPKIPISAQGALAMKMRCLNGSLQ